MAKFTGEAPREFETVPEGDYGLTILKISEETAGEKSKNPGAEMWRVTYEIDGTANKVFDNLVFVKKSFWRISNWWRALGNEVIPKVDIDLGNPEDHLKKRLRAHLVIEDYQGSKQNRIDYFIEPKPDEDHPERAAMVPHKSEDSEPDDVPF